MKQTLVLIHASPAAIAPVARYYCQQAPELNLVNLLDDGILAYFNRADRASAFRRLASMITVACQEYHAAAVIVTCSSAEVEDVRQLRVEAGIPVLKIDEPMARRAVAAGRRIAAIVTFEPTAEVTRRLLLELGAAEVGVSIASGAYNALLNGDAAGHDRCVLAAVEAAAGEKFDCMVLAQVSMAHLRDEAQRRARIPVFSSLETSLEAVRTALLEHG